MRILVDVRHRRTLSGSVSYIYNVLPGLTSANPDHEFLVLRFEGQALPDIACETVSVRPQRAAQQMIYDQLILPRLIRRLGADVYHPLKYLGTAFPPCRQVTTLHAITEPYRGQFPSSFAESLYWRHAGRRIIASSAHVIAVSSFIRDFLVECLHKPADRVTVIPHGVDPRFRRLTPPAHAGSVDAAQYLLTVGNIFPVKNFVIAVEVLAALEARFPNLRLKMAGATDHAYCAQVRQVAESAGVLERVDFLGYVSPDDLVPLMNGALFLLMPSLTEGCPVTLLEAMACGLPVIGSARGGIPEIGGDAIEVVDDPFDVATWIDTADRLMREEARRRQLSARALERAARFTWPEVVRATLGVYDRLGA